ncbi:MAG TPA: TonB-dependent receptor [Blastocatellia bacterium]|nr:TonB-dependent receptor [Blastocatellia bacterium]
MPIRLARPYLTFFLLFICLHLSFIPTLAQAGRAEMTGEVRDQNGAGIGAARVSLTDLSNGNAITTTSGADGSYTVTNLKPGGYSIAVEAPGFRRMLREGVSLVTGERLRLDLTLTPGEMNDVITVTADAPLLRSETGSLGQVIDNRKIVSLPLNGRNFLSLVSLAPGVAAPPRTAEGPSFPRINGGRPRVNEYLFDGISALQPEPGQIAFFPIVEAIQEFKVEINSPAAEFGRFNGGVVNLTTKSGTNDFHGSVFEFFRNETLNARNLFAPRTAASPAKPVFRRNQFGDVIGGPIIKNRTFFFADYQGTRQLIGRVRVSSVPTIAQRNGDFSASFGGPLYFTPPGTVTTVATGNTAINVTDTNGNLVQARQGMIFRPSDKRAYAGNVIPLAEFDPVARALLDRYPLPTSAGAANNYSRVGNEEQDQDQFDVRLDHRFSEHDQVFGRYSFARDTSDPVTPLPDGSGNITGGAIGLTKTTAQQVVGNYLHVFNQALLNELRFGHTRRAVNRRAVNRGEAVAIPGIPTNEAFGGALPTFTISGLQQLGPPAGTNSDFQTDVTQIFDSVSLQRGRNSIKAGADFRVQRLDVLQPPSPSGQFTFNNLFTNSQGLPQVGTALAGLTGNPLAGFLLGQVSGFAIDLQPQVLRPRARILEFFAQDDWKVSRRLTVGAGLRYTLNFPSTEADNRGAIFNLDTQQLEYLGRNGFPRTARDLEKLNFGPRLGLAYRINEQTVVRAGYGLIWQEQAGITTPFTIPQFPFVQTVAQRTLDNVTPAFRLAGGTTVTPIPPTPDAGLGQGVFAVDRHLGSGYTSQWNLAVQRELKRDLVVEIAYAGSKVTHVGIPDVNINQLTVAQLQQGASLLDRVPNPYFRQIPRNSSLGDPTITRAQLLKPFPRFTAVSFYRNNVGNTNYHALQVKLEQRLTRGLSLLVAYTRSKLIDEASSVFDATIQTGPVANFPVADSFNRKLERDVSTGDIPNVFVASFTYELPVGKGRAFDPAGVIGGLLTGWQLNGIVNCQSGVPLAVSQATNFNAFAGFGTQRPNQSGKAELPASQRTTARWFNADAFIVAPQFTLGTSSRNPVRGPGLRNLDLALAKRTNLTERINLEFRAEVFNFTNTPPLGNPNVILGSPGFGSITSAGDPRVVQFGLKLNF